MLFPLLQVKSIFVALHEILLKYREQGKNKEVKWFMYMCKKHDKPSKIWQEVSTYRRVKY